MHYPGGKGKTYQHIINLMPPHEVYVETHLGGGAVLRNKKPSTKTIAIDLDARVVESWRSSPNGDGIDLFCMRAEEFLQSYSFTGGELLYVDPPYHPSTRRQARVYKHDYSHEDHERLLGILVRLPCRVILSGYANPLYEQMLAGWRTQTFRAKTHTDLRVETVWLNYEPPAQLHDCRFLGADFRERLAVKRRLQRLQSKFRSMDRIERSAFIEWLNEEYAVSLESSL